jgi:hypothetical protein
MSYFVNQSGMAMMVHLDFKLQMPMDTFYFSDGLNHSKQYLKRYVRPENSGKLLTMSAIAYRFA